MLDKVAARSEGGEALVALVRPLPRVSPLVPRQRSRFYESCIALITLVRLLARVPAPSDEEQEVKRAGRREWDRQRGRDCPGFHPTRP